MNWATTGCQWTPHSRFYLTMEICLFIQERGAVESQYNLCDVTHLPQVVARHFAVLGVEHERLHGHLAVS
jgi:hypothetical protein